MKIYITILLTVSVLLNACTSSLPEKSTDDFQKAISAFYVGLAALQVGDDQRAGEELAKAKNLAEGEPAIWNNLGVLEMRQKKLPEAAKSLETAKNLAPDNALIYSNLAVLETQLGNFEKAVANLNKTIELEPKKIQAIYLLAQEKEREKNDAEALKLFEKILEIKPGNLAVQLEVARLSAKLGNKETLTGMVEKIGQDKEKWSDEIKKQFDELKTAATAENIGQAATKVAFFRNALLRDSRFRSSVAEIKPSDTSVGQPMLKPVKLETPDFSPAEPDLDITFEAKNVSDKVARFAKAVFLNGEKSVVAWADEKETHIGETVLPFGLENSKYLTAFDFDYDYKNDLAIADEKGFKLFKQTEDGKFEDVTTATKISSDVLSKSYDGVWVLDVDNEGDLDLFLAPEEGEPVVLQNNADGTFKETKPFKDVDGAIDFAYADLDEDGDSDAVILAKNKLRVFSNERGGLFKERNMPETALVQAIQIGDINGDGKLDLVFEADFKVYFLTDKNGLDFEIKELFETNSCEDPIAELVDVICKIEIADFDNNGGNDVLISSYNQNSLFLNGKDGKLLPAKTELKGSVKNSSETNKDGKPDLIGVDKSGKPTIFENKSTKDYGWQILKPKSAKTEGDQRINTFGIGGEIEIRSGLHTQKQLITSPQVHFGLGEMKNVDVARIVWQNGYVQAEFDLEANKTIAAEQRLKGSCPHLFTWNGKEFVHVKDAPPWSPALGLKINAQDTYGILQTEEWFKIPGEALQPKDGFYELRITGEYWESFYLDNYKLLAVDRKEDTEIFTDERFAIPLPPLKVFTTEKTKPFAKATDHNGKDVLETVSKLDEKYLDDIKRGKFQGVAEDHYVELELPADAPPDKKLWLVGDGWVHPTDASINVQRGQMTDVKPPQSLSIEIEDENGNWKAVKENLGFPAGKMKTVLLDLEDIFPTDTKTRRFRLRTNMEIFWDKLAWAVDLPENESKIKELDLAEASLRYRGFSVIEKADDSSPEVPRYDMIMTTNQRWRDLEGYYTRFGDVKELLVKTDDRFVLQNAGDELILKFPVLPDVEKGWKRDFVIIGNGWIKDGDLNSVFSKTLLPLPTQATNDYTQRPTTLEDDPVYQKNKADWTEFHTRYVSPDSFRNALR